MNKAIVGILLILLAGSALALFAEVPREVVLQGENTRFPISITNTLNANQPLSVEFFTANRVSFNAPSALAPNQTISVIVTADNPAFLQNTTYESRVVIKAGVEQSTHLIRFVFPGTANDQNNSDDDSNNSIDSNNSGFTGFLFAGGSKMWNQLSAWGTSGFSWMTNTKIITNPISVSVFQALLLVIVIILGVTFFVRFLVRVQGT